MGVILHNHSLSFLIIPYHSLSLQNEYIVYQYTNKQEQSKR